MECTNCTEVKSILQPVLISNCTDWNDSTKGTIIPTTNIESKINVHNVIIITEKFLSLNEVKVNLAIHLRQT